VGGAGAGLDRDVPEKKLGGTLLTRTRALVWKFVNGGHSFYRTQGGGYSPGAFWNSFPFTADFLKFLVRSGSEVQMMFAEYVSPSGPAPT
jgi:hypothetical protein